MEENFREPSAEFRATVPLSAFPGNATFPSWRKRPGRAFSITVSGCPTPPRASLPPQDEGFAVYKKIETLDGRPLADIPAGSLAVVTLEIAVPKESLFVVVDDPLPAGFEAVNANFRTESEERFRDSRGPRRGGRPALVGRLQIMSRCTTTGSFCSPIRSGTASTGTVILSGP